MIKENQLQGLKRLESFIKENMPRYKTRWHQGKLYVETIFSYLEVKCSATTKGVSYELNIYGKIVDLDKEDQLRKVFKDLYDEEIRLENKYIKKMEINNE